MKLFKIGKSKKTNKVNSIQGGREKDDYQKALEKLGGEQFKRLVDKGLSLPVAML